MTRKKLTIPAGARRPFHSFQRPLPPMTAAASVRLKIVYWHLLCHISTVLALPFTPSTFLRLDVVSRDVIVNNSTGVPQIFDSSTEQIIPQGPATDGSGTNFSLPAVIWIVFCFAIGIPMAVAGIRGWRLTTGVGIGLPAAACCMPPPIFSR